MLTARRGCTAGSFLHARSKKLSQNPPKSKTAIPAKDPSFPQKSRHSRESGNPVVQTVYLAVEIKAMTVLR